MNKRFPHNTHTHTRAAEHKQRVEATEAKLVEVLQAIDDDMNQ